MINSPIFMFLIVLCCKGPIFRRSKKLSDHNRPKREGNCVVLSSKTNK